MAEAKQVELLRQGVEVWNQYAQTVDKIDLSWANLEGVDLPRADLREWAAPVGGEPGGGGPVGGEP